MCLIAKVIRISHAKFHCNRLTRYSRLYASLIWGGGMHCRNAQFKPTLDVILKVHEEHIVPAIVA